MSSNQQVQLAAPHNSKRWTVIGFLLGDLILNCTLDYDSYNDFLAEDVLYALLAAQLVIEVAIFMLLFVSMADTFLFRVGLLGQLLKKFRIVLAIQPVYLIFTLITGTYRYSYSGRSGAVFKLWQDDAFVALSHVHKIGNNRRMKPITLFVRFFSNCI